MNRREKISIIATIAFFGLGLLSNILDHSGNAQAARIAGIGGFIDFAYLGFELLVWPEFSILYRINKRWTPIELARLGGCAGMLFALGVVAIMIYYLFNPQP
jgi:hypothetical protein